MSDPDIEAALIAFESSRTAASSLGKLVTKKLREYQDDDEIGFDPLTPTTYGLSNAHRFGPNIRVNDGYRGDVGTTSLVLAHEGVHRITNTSSFDEEMACFDFQIQYYSELLGGVYYMSPATKARTRAHTNASIKGAPSETDTARNWLVHKQLMDFVLAKPIYQDKITASWVKSNLSKWGGLRNRWATSKGVFIRALAAEEDRANAMLILDILESIGQPADWNEMLRVAGDFKKAKRILHAGHNAPIMGSRMDALSKKWNIRWNPD